MKLILGGSAMKPQTTRLSAWMAICLVSSYVVCPTFTRADATGIAGPGSSIANNGANNAMLRPIPVIGSVLDAKGQVDKRDPIDQGDLGAAVACKKGDQLLEGSIVKTGKQSMATLSWNGTTTRVWSDSLVRCLPGAKTVCLMNGSLIFNKTPRCTDNEVFIETKRLQARIRGTVVTVHSDENVDTILVTEMKNHRVEVFNKINGSRVSLSVGVQLQVTGKVTTTDPRFILKSENPPAPQNFPVTILNPNKAELIFQDKHSRTVAYTANSKAVLADPMFAGSGTLPAYEDLDLVRGAMSKVPSSDNLIENLVENTINAGKPDKFIAHNLKILSVPPKQYWIGPNVGPDKAIALPPLALTDMHPAGVISAIPGVASGSVASVPSRPMVAPVMLLHEGDIPAEDPLQEQQDVLGKTDAVEDRNIGRN